MGWYSKLWVKVCLLAIAVGLAAGVYAYSVLFQPTGGPRASITSEPLIFSIELDRSEFQYGENLTMTFHLENVGNETITIRRSNPGWWNPNYTETSYHNVHASPLELDEFHFGFSVAYANGTEFFEVGRGSLPYAYDLEIDLGGWIEQSIIAHTLDIPEHKMSYAWLIPLTIGNYQIRGIFRFRYTLDQSPYVTLETPSIAFAIQ